MGGGTARNAAKRRDCLTKLNLTVQIATVSLGGITLDSVKVVTAAVGVRSFENVKGTLMVQGSVYEGK